MEKRKGKALTAIAGKVMIRITRIIRIEKRKA